jgi:hypothetical protein
VLCVLFWIVASDLLWDGYPWKYLERNGKATWVKGVVVLVVTFLLGVIVLYVLMQIMNYFWDEPFMGGQYTDGPDFRFIHAGEICGFFILAAFILKNYFNNFPNIPIRCVEGRHPHCNCRCRRHAVLLVLLLSPGNLFLWPRCPALPSPVTPRWCGRSFF